VRDREAAPPVGASRLVRTRAWKEGLAVDRDDTVVVEEPLEIRVVQEQDGRRRVEPIAVTMRTPGHDLELAVGFLLSEGLLARPEQVWDVAHCESDAENGHNVVEVRLAPDFHVDVERLRRNVYTSSSCGICGRAALDRVQIASSRRPVAATRLDARRLPEMAQRLEAVQTIFSRTGGLHAAVLFDTGGELLLGREDIGRHNAFDKLLGRLLLDDRLPADERWVLVSGRASFELVQKAVMGGIACLAAVGAPSSLAIDLAREYGLTLVGFLRDGRFNVYCGAERLGGLGIG
jgi:FdhD protein